MHTLCAFVLAGMRALQGDETVARATTRPHRHLQALSRPFFGSLSHSPELVFTLYQSCCNVLNALMWSCVCVVKATQQPIRVENWRRTFLELIEREKAKDSSNKGKEKDPSEQPFSPTEESAPPGKSPRAPPRWHAGQRLPLSFNDALLAQCLWACTSP
jgi:hypothetical protein